MREQGNIQLKICSSCHINYANDDNRIVHKIDYSSLDIYIYIHTQRIWVMIFSSGSPDVCFWLAQKEAQMYKLYGAQLTTINHQMAITSIRSQWERDEILYLGTLVENNVRVTAADVSHGKVPALDHANPDKP